MNRAIFFDMQGTLGGQGLDDAMSFRFFPFAAEAILRANRAGVLAIVITNQSHIAKGHFTLEQFNEKMAGLNEELLQVGAHIDRVYCCPHDSSQQCVCRKPSPHMVFEARDDYDLDLDHCYMVGDAGAWDMLMAKNAGCKSILVKTGLGSSSLAEYRHTWAGFEPDYVAENVLDAVRWSLEREGTDRD